LEVGALNIFDHGLNCIVHDENSHLFGKVVRVCSYDKGTDVYFVALASAPTNTILFTIKRCFLTKVILGDEYKKLQKEHLKQMIDFALEIGDKRWFVSLVKKLNKLE
jgi:hypothetical protein